ncbi:MAG TPA: hypothetical protein PLJ42_05290 [Chitinophagales bacterium]|jgi:hypothetical protein|nr:hypothetical protein [Chitinophagales bacterium]HQV78483.1 hypothetical protein [Chitinophagales bacterium]HQW78831.1 hypothetical protein [Chitinophagales bacterium]HRB66743.1 hypothetical protein [Chitinophagales bacterium]HRB93256.1 hypothetical protein [Chitinophagales bacterium]
MKKKSAFNLKNVPPIKQGLAIVLIILIVSIVCLIIDKRDVMTWNFIIIPLFLFSVYNPIIGILQHKLLPYIGMSCLVFIVLVAFVYFTGNFVSKFPYSQVQELHTILPTIIIFYIMFHFLSFIFRTALNFLKEI